MKKSMVFLVLLLCVQLRLLLASPAQSSSSPGADLESRWPETVAVVVNRKGGGGHGGGRGGGKGRVMPFYGGNRNSNRSNGHHNSGSNRLLFTSAKLTVVALLCTAIIVGLQ